MLFKKGLLILSVLALVVVLSGCGKKAEEQQQEEAAATPAKKVVELEDLGKMVMVPAGEFIMGSNTKDKDNKPDVSFPEHKVNLPAFWIDQYEVTNYQMLDFSIKAGYTGEGAKEGKDWRSLASSDKALFPVQLVTINDAKAYCQSVGKRLPTEAEWEKAARGPDGKAYPWGKEWMDNRSNTAEANIIKPVAVGDFDDVSQYGANDMLGNVREWTSTPFEYYAGHPDQKKNPYKGRFVVRGLSPNHKGKMFQLSYRDGYPVGFLGDVGFRCAKDATPEEAAQAK